MNKGELIKAIANKAEISQKAAAASYEAFVEVVKEALTNGEKVQLVGFGTFELKDIPAKTAINPQTKEKVQVAACKKPVMKFGKAYKDSFNN